MTVKTFLQSALPQVATKNELVVVPPSPPSLDDLMVSIRKAHADVEASLLTATERSLEAGTQLKLAKDCIPHGSFEDYVARCGISMRAAQNYMRIAKYEPEVRQLLASKAQGHAYLGVGALLKYVAMLDAKKRPKAKRKPT